MRLLYKIELLENQWHELVNDISPSASKIHCSVSYAIVTDCMLQTEVQTIPVVLKSQQDKGISWSWAQ